MGAKGIVIAEECHVVNILPPKDSTGGIYASDIFSMKDAAHASIILQVGASAGAVSTLTVLACDDFTPSNTTAIAFNVYKCETGKDAANCDVLGARTAVTSAGFAFNTTDNIFYVVEVDAAELPAGRPNLQISLTDPTASQLINAVAILSGLRIAAASQLTETA